MASDNEIVTASNRTLYIEQGATFRLGFNWMHGVEVNGVVTQGDPYDLTDAVVRMQIRKKRGTDVLFSASSEGSNPKFVLDPLEGRIDLKMSGADTNALVINNGMYDLEVELPNGDIHRLLQGAVQISPNVTQGI